MQSLPCKVALLSILLALCVNSQGLPFYFDPLGNIGGTSFTPLSIPNCGLWLDASDASTVRLSGVSVTNWINKAVQGDSARVIGATNTYPSFCSAELNGKCTVYFDGADYLKSSFLSSTGTTVFVVAKLVSGEAITGARDSDNTRSYWGSASGENVFRYGVGTANGVSISLWGINYRLFTGTHTGTNVSLYAEGTNVLENAQSGSGANFTRTYYIGGAQESTGALLIPSVCYVAELVCYNRALTEPERISVEVYLAQKWFNR